MLIHLRIDFDQSLYGFLETSIAKQFVSIEDFDFPKWLYDKKGFWFGKDFALSRV